MNKSDWLSRFLKKKYDFFVLFWDVILTVQRWGYFLDCAIGNFTHFLGGGLPLLSHAVHRFDVEFGKRDGGVILEIKQETHVERQRQQRSVASNVVVAEFDGLSHVVVVGMVENGGQALGLSRLRLHFERDAFAPITHEEVEFEPRVLPKVIQFLAAFAKEVGHQVLEDGALVTEQVALEDIGARARIE